jgi:hypothetical protein
MNMEKHTTPNQESTGCFSKLVYVSIQMLAFVSSTQNLFYWKFCIKMRIVNVLVRVLIWSLSMNFLTANDQKREGQMLFAGFLYGRINNFFISKEQRSMIFVFDFDIFTFFGVRNADLFHWRIHILFKSYCKPQVS